MLTKKQDFNNKNKIKCFRIEHINIDHSQLIIPVIKNADRFQQTTLKTLLCNNRNSHWYLKGT